MDKQGYCLIQIYEEAVPLAAYSDSRLFVGMIIAMVLIILGLVVLSYLAGCIQCRRRITELNEERKNPGGWNLRQLKKTISDLELQKAGDLFAES